MEEAKKSGVSLTIGKPRIPRDYRRKLRQELFLMKKYGLKGHMNHNTIRGVNYNESLLGKVNYGLFIEPDNEFARKMQKWLKKEIYYK